MARSGGKSAGSPSKPSSPINPITQHTILAEIRRVCREDWGKDWKNPTSPPHPDGPYVDLLVSYEVARLLGPTMEEWPIQYLHLIQIPTFKGLAEGSGWFLIRRGWR